MGTLKLDTAAGGSVSLVANDTLTTDEVIEISRGGTISNFTSTGIDDNATGTKLTISDTTITGVGAFTSTSIDATKLSGALPAIDGSALTSLTSSQMPAGSVLQVVQGLNGNQSSFTGTSGACGASVTITPKLASSKILVIVNIDGITVTNGNSGYGRFYVTRNSANISFFGYPRNWQSTDNSSGTTMATTYLDSPSSTSALTYGTSWANLSGSVTIQINRDGATYSKSTITVMEIAQ